MTQTPRRLVIGISGASARYGIRMLEIRKDRHRNASGHEQVGEMTLVYETNYKPKDVRRWPRWSPAADIGASISSGSFARWA
jgi:3-polyprenyl-4-hydroxybenzoate decarboxylase